MITVEKLKQIIPISKNIDNNIIQPQIAVAQVKYIKPILGKYLYDDIAAKYASQTLSGAELTLIVHIQNCLAFYITDNALPYLSFAITEKGIQQQNGVNSQPGDTQSSTTSLNYMRNEIRNNAEFYGDILRDYLDDNKESFPLYTQSGNDPKTQSNFDAGIVFFDTDLNNTRNYYM